MNDDVRKAALTEAVGFFRHALADIAASRAIVGAHLQDPDSDAFTAAFHLQQAVEKAIKCLLVLAGRDFAKSHDLASLQALLPDRYSDVASMEAVDDLTAYAVQTRYPDSATWLQWQDVEEAQVVAVLVVERTKAHLEAAQGELPQEPPAG